MKRLILLSLALNAIFAEVRATHLYGGEVTWECTSTGQYIFTAKCYRTCAVGSATSIAIGSLSNPFGPAIGMPLISQTDISPECYNPLKGIDCFGGTVQSQLYAIEEFYFRSAAVTLSGVPAAGGSMFYATTGARPNGIINSNTGGNFIWRAVMYPYYENGVPKNVSTCYDNSPQFAEKPAAIICTGYKFTYNHNATDADLDSLDYQWAQSWTSVNVSIAYNSGFSYTSPLPSPGVPSSPNNVAATLNNLTGEIQYTSFDSGRYYTTVEVNAYRCQQRIAAIYRDIPTNLLTCPPTATFPPLSNTPPAVDFKHTGSSVPYILPAGDTVYAGDSVEFILSSVDIQFLPGPKGQTNYLRPSGSQFGTLYSDPNGGCLYPPCATLDTANVYYDNAKNEWSGQFGISTTFKWKTTCNHLAQVYSCFTRSNTYTFVFKVFDDWCPAPGMNFQTFAVTVLAPPALEPPVMKCAQVKPDGSVILKWNQPVTLADDTLESFRKYIIYRASSAAGPYDTLVIVTDIDSVEYHDITANAYTSSRYYFIQGISSCNDQGVTTWSDTISAMKLVATVFNSGNSVALDWNDYSPGNRFGAKTTGEYYVWLIHGTDTILEDTTLESYDTLDVHLCYPDTVEYMITVIDTTRDWGCTSNSTISGGPVGDNLAPDPVALDEVSYDLNNEIIINWSASSPDVGMYYIYKNGVLIDSVAGGATTFSYVPLPTDQCVMEFMIRARDTCGNLNTVGLNQFSMCTEILDVQLCELNKRVVIGWNIYNPGWTGGSGNQEIYKSVNYGPYALLATVPASQTQYDDTAISSFTRYAYRVRSLEVGNIRSALSSWDSVTVPKLVDSTVVPAPDLRCVSWLNDTTLRLEWNKPVNTASNFNRYIIYHSTNGTTYTKSDSINGIYTSDNLAWDSTGYTYVNASPGTEHYFYVVSSSGCNGLVHSAPGKKLQAINLGVTIVSDSVDKLDWNPISATAFSPQYTVWRDGSQHGSAPFGSETYRDGMVICDLNVKYQVTYPDGTGRCSSNSRIIDGQFRDKTPPLKQFLDSVSVTPDSMFTGLVGWTANASQDVVRYYVVECLPGSYKILDTIPAGSPLFYEDLKNSPLKTIKSYSVVAEDSCGKNRLSQLDLNCHSTIFMTTTLDFCDQSILLEWNGYDDFTSGPSVEYTVYVSLNGNDYQEAGKTRDLYYRYKDLVNGNNYCFYVQARENDGAGPFSSSSGIRCMDVELIRKPEFAYMRYVTVLDTIVRMCMKIDLQGDIGEYWVKKSTQKDQGYSVVATVPLPDPVTAADSNFCFEDIDVSTSTKSYYYRVDVVDPCGDIGIISNVGRTMLLKVEADNEKNVNVLTWNKYQEWEGEVKEYEIWRGTDRSSLSRVTTLPVNLFDKIDELTEVEEVLIYRDDISAEASSGNGEFCYLIIAVEGSGTFQNIPPESSSSNIACTVQYPLFYVPTAFTPNGDGKNDVFRPKGSFHDLKAYYLEIYNRWGELIYQTDDYEAGWDGTYKGRESPSDAYVYIVRYSSADGKGYEERGTLSLTR